MSQSRNKRAGKRGKAENAEVRVVYKNQISKRTAIIISAVVIALIIVIILISNFFSIDGQYLRLKIITIDDKYVTMDYFLRRARISGSDPMSLLNNIAKEMVISEVASQLGIEISDEAIEQELIKTAKGESETISAKEYKEWYRQTLNESNLSDSEYRNLISVNLQATIIRDMLGTQLPTTAEHRHVHTIMAVTEKEALNIKTRLESGEDFATIALNESIDATTRDNGGDLGWAPRGVLTPQIENVVWEIAIGTISDPIIFYDANDYTNTEPLGYYIIMVSEEEDAREIDEIFIPTLKTNAFNDWYTEEAKIHEIKYHGLYNGFDSEAYAWVNYQLSKTE